MRSPFLVHESSLTSVFKFHQFLALFFSAIEFCIPFSRKCLPVLTLGHPEDCIEKLGCPFFLSFSSLLLSSLPLLVINSQKTSFWWFGGHKQLLLVATFPASPAGHFEEARKSMCHAFSFHSCWEQDHSKLVSILVSCARRNLIPKPSPTIHREGHVALEPLLWRFLTRRTALSMKPFVSGWCGVFASCSHSKSLHDFTNAFEPSV